MIGKKTNIARTMATSPVKHARRDSWLLINDEYNHLDSLDVRLIKGIGN